MPDVRLQVDTERVTAGLDRVRSGINPPGAPIRRGLLAAIFHFLSFEKRRFDRESQGGGEWPDIKESTKRARVRRAVGRVANIRAFLDGTFFLILRDLGTLRNALEPGDANNVRHDRPMGVELEVTVPYARFHQEGTSHMPERAIFVDPDADTIGAIRADLENGVADVVRSAGLSNG